MPWDDASTPEAVKQDFKQLWGTTFLDNLSIEVTDYPFSNGVVGKLIAYNIEERQRVKVVDYEGAKHLEESKIDEKLKEENATIRLDSFIDPAMVRKVKKIVLDMLAEKGYQFASVTPEIKPIAGGPKLVNLTFVVDEGPQVKIRDVDFTGNKAVSDGKLKRQMKNNKGKTLLVLHHRRRQLPGSASTRKTPTRCTAFYRDHGYIGARVGDPELRYVEDSADRKTRWVMLRIPVVEGERYRVAELSFEGNKIVKSEALRGLFKVAPGDWYSDKVIRKGYEKARDLYGAGGYYQFNLVPMTRPHDPNAPRRARRSPARRRRGGRSAAGRSGRGGQARRSGARAAGEGGPEAERRRRPSRPPRRARSRRPASRCPRARRSSRSCSRSTRASSTSSTGSSSPATRPRATPSCGANSGCSRKASSTPRR